MWHTIAGHIGSFLGGGSAWSIASYAAQNFPVPDGKYARWFLLIVQKALANPSKADAISTAIAKESSKSV